jgi:SAM-dependent methyltransferase
MTRPVTALVLVLLFSIPIAAQQTGLTPEQQKSAEVEVPQLVKLLQLQPGSVVADVGAGFGAWTVRFSRAVGPTGHVYSTDIGVPQLAFLRESVKREKLTNVTVLEGAAQDTKLPENCCDAILIRDAYHHLTHPYDIIQSMTRSLKPGGMLAVVDFPPRANTEPPDGVLANRGGHGVPLAVVEREVGVLLTHVQSIPKWSKGNQESVLFLALFRKP